MTCIPTTSVDNNLEASHTPATADANHVFSLENGILKVEIPNNTGNGTDYELIDGVLSVNPGFTGSITAEYEFITSPTREIDFAYDHNGLRTQKKVVENGITTICDYTFHGKLITHLTKRTVDENGAESTEELHFFYDVQSRPAKVSYNGVMYTYIHNLQDDIVGILDNAGALVVEYKYDAWGRLLSTTGIMADTLGKRNPFRYRGYVYDEETELYYLANRYYVPGMSRFLNADGYVATSEDLLACDMFAYCSNLPIVYFDPTGTDCICLHQRVHGNHICHSEIDSQNTAPSTVLYSEHKKNARPSTQNQHENGQSRKQRDARGEKGDARRKDDRSNKRKSKIETVGASILLLGAIIYVAANDITGVGAADDASLVPLGAMLWDNLCLLFA